VPALALTLRQPWLWAVLHAGKRVENRGSRLPEGPLWFHAGRRSGFDEDAVSHPLVRAAWTAVGHRLAELGPDTDLMPFGVIAALVTVTGAHRASTCAGPASDGYQDHVIPGDGAETAATCDPWAASGQVHNWFTITAVLGEPAACRGMPGLWPVPADVLAACAGQVGRQPGQAAPKAAGTGAGGICGPAT
jgi:hypothetical protein